MADFVQNDTGSTQRVEIVDAATGAAVNLTGAVVRYKWRDAAGALVVRVATVVNGAGGIAEYKFAAGELQPSLKEIEVEVTFAGGDVVTGTRRVRVRVLAELA
jgi:hypothetical protein